MNCRTVTKVTVTCWTETEQKEKMEEERAEKLRTLLDSGLHQLYGLWDEIGEEDCFQIVTLESFKRLRMRS